MRFCSINPCSVSRWYLVSAVDAPTIYKSARRAGGRKQGVSGMRVTVDREACVGAGQCVMAAGEVFDQDDDGIVILLNEKPDPSLLADVRRAVSLCPARAISLEE